MKAGTGYEADVFVMEKGAALLHILKRYTVQKSSLSGSTF